MNVRHLKWALPMRLIIKRALPVGLNIKRALPVSLNLKRALPIGLGALALSACGTTHSKDDASVAQIKTAALVAFSAVEPQSASIMLGNTKSSDPMMNQGSMISGTDPSVDTMYSSLNKAFNANEKWNMMSEGSMIDKPAYQKAFDTTMKGFQNKMPPGAGRQQFLVNKIMDYDAVRILGVKRRDDLIEALGVDAIIVARVDVRMNATTVMGIGSHHPQSVLSFFVYEKGKEKPVWFEGGIKGDEAESVGKTNFYSEDLVHRYALKSAVTAFDKIGATASK